MNDSSSLYCRLPVVICPASTPQQLQSVLELRTSGYGRHSYVHDNVVALMQRPDEMDLDGLSTTLIATDKQTRRVVGTVRLTFSLDRDIEWPEGTPQDECRSEAYTYLDRFAVDHQYPQAELVASALMKASYLWACSRDSQWGAAMALPALARIYKRRGGLTVRGGGAKVYLPEYHSEGFVLVGARVSEIKDFLARVNPQYSADFFNKVHPDICVHGVSLPWGELAPRVGLRATGAG